RTSAVQRSMPGATGVIGVQGDAWAPRGPLRTTLAPTSSWPSRNTVAVAGKVSPTTAFAGKAAQSTHGCTSTIGIRPVRRPIAAEPIEILPGGPPGWAWPAGSRPRRATGVFGVAPEAVTRTLLRMRAIRRFTVRTTLPEPLAPLGELVTNLRWSWHPETRDLFAAVDPEVWAAGGHDPLRLLGAVSPERLAELAADDG